MIIDTFIFNNDFNALKIRLDELSSVVDVFIISESAFTHSGLPKPTYLSDNRDFLAPYPNEFHLVTDKKRYLTRNPRVREQIQRQNISKVISKMKLQRSDLIIHSDCDEIPSAKAIYRLKSIRGSVNAILQLRNYANALNLQNGYWERVRVVTADHFRSIQHLRKDIFLKDAMLQKTSRIPLIRVPDYWTTRRFYLWLLPENGKHSEISVIPDSGWHFNNLITRNQVEMKIKSSCHVELSSEKSVAMALQYFDQNREIYGGAELELVPIDDTFPIAIRKNLSDWQNLIK
jgi:beta-1,4-mannosyl-glycoprotein beta-1,4-N-acetylglucosaminyltransferase